MCRPSGEIRGWLQTGQESLAFEPGGNLDSRCPVSRSTRTRAVAPKRRRTATAHRPSGEGSASATSAPRVTRATSPCSTVHRYKSHRKMPSASGDRRAKSTSFPPGIHRGSAAAKPSTRGSVHRGWRCASLGAPREFPDGEKAPAPLRVAPRQDSRAVGRHLSRPRAAVEALPELPLHETRGREPRLLLQGIRGDLLGEALIERPRSLPENRPGRRPGSRSRTWPCAPRAGQAVRAAALRHPLEIGGADEVGRRAAEPAALAAERVVLRELLFDRELAQHHRAEAGGRPARTGQRAFDQRCVTFDHPTRRSKGQRPEGNRRQALEEPSGPLLGRLRWTMWASSCVASSCGQSEKSPESESGSGGVAQRRTSGRSRYGMRHAVGFGRADRRGSPRCGGPAGNRRIRSPRPRSPSIDSATCRAHGSNARGKWMRKCSVSMVRQSAEGPWAAAGDARSKRRSAIPPPRRIARRLSGAGD